MNKEDLEQMKEIIYSKEILRTYEIILSLEKNTANYLELMDFYELICDTINGKIANTNINLFKLKLEIFIIKIMNIIKK